MAEEKWWLTSPLTAEARACMTEAQRQERRAMMVDRRLEEARKNLSATRSRRMRRWMTNWFRGEVLARLPANYSPDEWMREWLRSEFVRAVKEAFTGRPYTILVENVVREEVVKAITGISGGHTRHTRQGQDAFRKYVEGIVRDETRKLVLDSITIEATIRGTVHQPAKGARALQLGEEETDR